jgi:hypothetical protein
VDEITKTIGIIARPNCQSARIAHLTYEDGHMSGKIGNAMALIVLSILSSSPAFAKTIGEALSDMGLQDSDPRGVILMVGCMCLLVLIASALIVTTLKLGSHRKNNPKNGA